MASFGVRNRNFVDENKTAAAAGVKRPLYANKQFPQKKLNLPLQPLTSTENEPVKRKILGGGNTLISVEYAEDICNYLLYLENSDILPPKFLDGNAIDGRMRQILVDWMITVQCRFELRSETVCLAAWMLDRCLLRMNNITKDNLQLLGATCLFTSSKYEEILPPLIQDFITISDNIFTRKDLCLMEHQVLRKIDFCCNGCNSFHFLKQYHGCLHASKEVYNLAKFICDVAMTAYGLAHHKPSVTGATALFLSSHILEQPIPVETFRHVIDLAPSIIEKTATQFAPYVLEFGQADYKLAAVREKYQKTAPVPFREVHVKRIRMYMY